MADDPAVAAALDAILRTRHLSMHMKVAEAVVAAVRPLVLEEAAQAIEAERMPQPIKSEPYWHGYDAAIFDVLEAVRALAKETKDK